MTDETHDTQAARLADKAKRLANECVALWQGRWSGDAKCTELHATIDALRDLAIPAGEAVAEVTRGGSDKFGRATVLNRWLDGAMSLPDGVHLLYASPQPAPEASQDGGGARAEADRFGQWFKENHRNIGATPSMIALSAWMAALRSPTAQAGAGEPTSSPAE